MRSALSEAPYRTFVRHLVALRRQTGVTQRDLAARLGRDQSYVNKTERFVRRMDPAEFMSWVEALGGDPVAEFGAVVAITRSERSD